MTQILWLRVFLGCFYLSASLWSQTLALSGRAIDESGRPLKGIAVRAVGIGEDTTGPTGEFRIRLPDAMKPGTIVHLLVSPSQWIPRDILDGGVTVRRADMPPFDLRLVRKGSLSLLTDARIRKLLEDARKAVRQPTEPGFDGEVIKTVSSLGLSANTVRKAIENWVNNKSGATAYDRGLAAFYKGDNMRAIREWEDSARLGEADLAETYAMLGITELDRYSPEKSLAWLQKALQLNPRGSSALLGMAFACVAAEQYYYQDESERLGCRSRPIAYFENAMREIKLQQPRVYALEAFLQLTRSGLAENPNEEEEERLLEEIRTEMSDLVAHSKLSDPGSEAVPLALLGILQVENEEYGVAETTFTAAQRAARNPDLKHWTSYAARAVLGESLIERDMVEAGLGAYAEALDSARRFSSKSLSQRMESTIHLHIARASARQAPPEPGGPNKGTHQLNENERRSKVAQECATAVAFAEASGIKEESLRVRLSCVKLELAQRQLAFARKYQEEAIDLAKRLYPENWRRAVHLWEWIRTLSAAIAAARPEEAGSLGVATWELFKRMEYPLSFPPGKEDRHHHSARRFPLDNIFNLLEKASKLDSSAKTVNAGREAQIAHCYFHVAEMSISRSEFDAGNDPTGYAAAMRHPAHYFCSNAIDANPSVPEGYLLRALIYLDYLLVPGEASESWAKNPAASAEADLRHVMKLPNRESPLRGGSTHDTAAMLLDRLARPRDHR